MEVESTAANTNTGGKTVDIVSLISIRKLHSGLIKNIAQKIDDSWGSVSDGNTGYRHTKFDFSSFGRTGFDDLSPLNSLPDGKLRKTWDEFVAMVQEETAAPWNFKLGADAIAYFSRHFKWSPGAEKVIVYVSNHKLESEAKGSLRQIENAIKEAQKNGVKVYTHEYIDLSDPSTKYERVAVESGGKASAGNNLDKFGKLLNSRFYSILGTSPGTPKPVATPEKAASVPPVEENKPVAPTTSVSNVEAPRSETAIPPKKETTTPQAEPVAATPQTESNQSNKTTASTLRVDLSNTQIIQTNISTMSTESSPATTQTKGPVETVGIAKVSPAISVSWGNNSNECLKTDDFEVISITVANNYSDITFKNFSIEGIYILDQEGNPAPALPDGTPSVEVLPVGPIFFGNIGPAQEGAPTAKAREIVLRSKAARPGNYILKFGVITFEAGANLRSSTSFEVELCTP